MTDLDTLKLIALPIILIIAWCMGECHVLDTTPSEREKYKRRKETIIKYYRKYFKKRKIQRTDNVLFE